MNAKMLLAMAPNQRRDSLMKFLEEEDGIEVFVAADIQEAQAKLNFQRNWDLILVDGEVPGGSWRRLLQCVVASRKNCEVIVCSRCGDEHLWREVIHCGAFDLIPEPYEKHELLRIVRNALDSHSVRRIVPFAKTGTD